MKRIVFLVVTSGCILPISTGRRRRQRRVDR